MEHQKMKLESYHSFLSTIQYGTSRHVTLVYNTNKTNRTIGKEQIIGLIFLAEIISESQEKHYLKGGELPTIIFPPIDFSKVDEETLALKRNRELNNGRLAMIAIMSFVAAANVPGSVPALAGSPMF